ncbi:NHL repeat-containing protein [Parasphingorhabdus pacifica]
MRRLAAACFIGITLLAGCAETNGSDPLQVTDKLVAAAPATSPPTTRTPAGTVLPTPPTQLTAYEPTNHTLATTHGKTLNLHDTRTSEKPPRQIELPSAPAEIRPTDNGQLLAALPDSDLIIRIDPRTGHTTRTPVTGRPVDATTINGQLAVALEATKQVAFVDDQGHRIRTTEPNEFEGPAQLFAVNDQIHVLDRLTTSITTVDPATADEGAALRAGQGATNAVTDQYGRLLVVDTRGNELLAFSTDPFLMKQRYPVPSAPFDIAYDSRRDLAWITLTESNEVVAYDIAGGQPEERHRLPTVAQPNSISLDPDTGEVYITSATGEGLQVVKV